MASAQQIIGLVKSHAEGDADRFYDLAMQLSAAEEQKGHTRLAEQLRQWAEAGHKPPAKRTPAITPIATPRGDLAEFLAASYPTERLVDVILPDRIESELAHLVVETRMREKLEAKGLKPRRRVLLSGPPGTGKTLSASALAGELQYPLFSVMLHGLITKFMGETAAKLRMIFDAMVSQRGVYFFDEFDAIGADRAASNDVGEIRRVLNSFLQFLEQDDSDSLIVAATNHVKMLDPALFRRFDDVVRYELPSRQLAQELMMNRLTVFGVAKIDWNQISAIADGLSYAEIARACDDAAREVVLTDRKSVDTDLLASTLRDRLGKTQA